MPACSLAAEPPELADPGDVGEDPEHDSDEPGMDGPGMQPPPAPPADPNDTGLPPAGAPGMNADDVGGRRLRGRRGPIAPAVGPLRLSVYCQ